MKTRTMGLARCLPVLGLAITAFGVAAGPARDAKTKKTGTALEAPRHCRSDEEAFTVLKLTTIEGGVRVDYEFVRSGQAGWTHMNRPLLRRFGVRPGATICLPRDPASDEDTDFD
jgi:hypothetical protein